MRPDRVSRNTYLYSIQYKVCCSNDGAVAKALDCFAPVAKVGCSTQAAAILLKVTTAYKVFLHRSPIMPILSIAPDYRCWGIKCVAAPESNTRPSPLGQNGRALWPLRHRCCKNLCTTCYINMYCGRNMQDHPHSDTFLGLAQTTPGLAGYPSLQAERTDVLDRNSGQAVKADVLGKWRETMRDCLISSHLHALPHGSRSDPCATRVKI
jgi:hypothetical protein